MKKEIVRITKGSKLSDKEAARINEIFQDAFSDKNTLEIGTRKQYKNNLFFILYKNEDIVSVARLRKTKITFMKKQYNISGIADMVSVIKKKGYGKRIMTSVHRYIKNKKLIGIGFCRKKTSPFYQKSGFKISKNLVKKIIYINPKGKVIKDSWDSDVIYAPENEKFIKTLLKNPKEKIILGCPFF